MLSKKCTALDKNNVGIFSSIFVLSKLKLINILKCSSFSVLNMTPELSDICPFQWLILRKGFWEHIHWQRQLQGETYKN